MEAEPKIAPCLWFDGRAEEAVAFYTSVFPNSKTVSTLRCGEAGPGPAGSVLSITFELDGRRFIALNGGPAYSFTPALSLFVACDSQDEIDQLWDRLLAGGEAQQCGWLKDRFGLSWQIVPGALEGMLGDENAERVSRVLAALFQMTKLDLGALQAAYDED